MSTKLVMGTSGERRPRKRWPEPLKREIGAASLAFDALRKGDTNANGTIELSELVAHVQMLVPRLAAQLGGTGTAKSAFRGSTTTSNFKQSARFGLRGEDFALVRQLQ